MFVFGTAGSVKNPTLSVFCGKSSICVGVLIAGYSVVCNARNCHRATS